jgi:hypothetical protein
MKNVFKKLSSVICGVALASALFVPIDKAGAWTNTWSLSDQASGFGYGTMYLSSQGDITNGFGSINYDGYVSTVVSKGTWDNGTNVTVTADARTETITAAGENNTPFDQVSKSSNYNESGTVMVSLSIDNTDSAMTALIAAKVYAYGSVSAGGYYDNLYGAGDRGM